jgi:ribosomal protein L7Ae-like RNA K-turn-binding protein
MVRFAFAVYEIGGRETIGRAIGKGERAVIGIVDTGFCKAIEAILTEERSKIDELDAN